MNYFTKANILANNTIALAQSHLQEEIKVGSYMVQVKSRLAEGKFIYLRFHIDITFFK